MKILLLFIFFVLNNIYSHEIKRYLRYNSEVSINDINNINNDDNNNNIIKYINFDNIYNKNKECYYFYLIHVEPKQKGNFLPFQHYLEYWWDQEENENELLEKVCNYIYKKYNNYKNT